MVSLYNEALLVSTDCILCKLWVYVIMRTCHKILFLHNHSIIHTREVRAWKQDIRYSYAHTHTEACSHAYNFFVSVACKRTDTKLKYTSLHTDRHNTHTCTYFPFDTHIHKRHTHTHAHINIHTHTHKWLTHYEHRLLLHHRTCAPRLLTQKISSAPAQP